VGVGSALERDVGVCSSGEQEAERACVERCAAGREDVRGGSGAATAVSSGDRSGRQPRGTGTEGRGGGRAAPAGPRM
jgi:hypothetical protein